jgi:hypothetical protein
MRKRVGSPKRSHHRPEQPADVIIAENGKILAIGKHLIARPLTERRDGQVKIGVIRNLGARQFSDVALQGPIIGKNEYPNRTAESQPVSPTEPESALLLQTKQSRRGLAAAAAPRRTRAHGLLWLRIANCSEVGDTGGRILICASSGRGPVSELTCGVGYC